MADTYTLADLMEEQRTAGPPTLGGQRNVIPREMVTAENARQARSALSNFVSSFGQPSLDALRMGYADVEAGRQPDTQGIARTFLETGPMGPFGMARVPRAAPPPASAEWPTSAAVRIGDRTFTGNSHFDAVTAAQRELGENALAGSNVAADGFLTNQGRYVSREEAGRMLDQGNNSRHYRTLFGNDRGLLSEALELYNPATGRETVGPLSRVRPDTTKGGGPRVPNPIRAYHGSPHDFDEFSMRHIGSGEGAQAYGHGLYFAERPEVARSYRQANEHWATPSTRAGAFLDRAGDDRARAIQLAQQEVDQWRPGTTPHTQATEALEALRSERPLGRMYEVNLHARPEQFLDWDRPLSRQPEAARNAIPNEWLWHVDDAERAGHLPVSVMSGLREPAVTDTLREAGIPGIRYLDQGSRGMAGWRSAPETSGPNRGLYQAGITRNGTREFQYFPTEQEAKAWAAAQGQTVTGTSNYVVFSPEIIEILRKYGIIAPPVGAAAASTLAGEPQP